MGFTESHRMKNYLVYAWHVLLLFAVVAIFWRIQNPPSMGITIAPYTHGTFHDVEISYPSELGGTFGALEFKGETRDGRMKVRLVRENRTQPFTIMVNGQFYGQVTAGDRLEIDYGPKVKVNGEDRLARPAEETPTDEAPGGT